MIVIAVVIVVVVVVVVVVIVTVNKINTHDERRGVQLRVLLEELEDAEGLVKKEAGGPFQLTLSGLGLGWV